MTEVRPPTPARIIVLTLAAFAAAIVVHTLLGVAGIGSDNAFRLLVTPIVGAAIVFFGLFGYPTGGRLRLAAMVGVLLLLFSNAA